MIQSVVLPGRFPTTFYAYPEFTLLNRKIRDEVRFENLNLLFWEYIFSADFLGFLSGNLGQQSALQIEFLSTVIDSGVIATLRDRKQFYDPERYVAAISHLGGYMAVASNLLRQLSGNLQRLSIYGVSYDSQRPLTEIMAYAGSNRSLVVDFYRTRSETIQKLFAADIVSAVTYNYTDILHLGVLCDRYRRPGSTVLIHGHSWENFAIDYLVEHNSQYTGFLKQIDGIAISENALAETFNQLGEKGVTAGIQNIHRFGDQTSSCGGHESGQRNALSEYEDIDKEDELDYARLRQEAELQRPKIFSPELVTLHRLSSRGCYWSRCAFCRHNSLHPERTGDRDMMPDDLAKWPARLRQFSEISPFLVFCDQGIDPEAAVALAAMAPDKGSAAKWSLRTRIDPRWDSRRIAAVAQGGCTELIFGLESINDATLRRMNKTPLSGEAYRSLVEQIHHDSAASGIYNHYCTIYGFPGETFEECSRTLKFLEDLIRVAPKTTFSLNRFQLLFKSDIYNSPDAYGISSMTKAASLSNLFCYHEPNSQRSIELVESGLTEFFRTIGYREDILASQILMQIVPAFINDSGHAPLLKAGYPRNPFIA
jgi:hypothetical protein